MDNLQIVEYEGVRVVTTKQIAEMYGTDSKVVSKNFNRNKDRYTEGKHYFLLQGQELKSFRQNDELPKNLNRLYLWTERGALLLAKSINTDVAWDAYERLVDFYFDVRTKFNPPVECFPEEKPRIRYQTSTTPVPRNPNWYARNRQRMYKICERAEVPVSTLYHHILLRIEEEFDLQAANEIYREELGHPPKYALDIVSYFPELARMADDYLDRLESLGT